MIIELVNGLSLFLIGTGILTGIVALVIAVVIAGVAPKGHTTGIVAGLIIIATGYIVITSNAVAILTIAFPMVFICTLCILAAAVRGFVKIVYSPI